MKARDLYWDTICNKSEDFATAEAQLLQCIVHNPFIAEPHLLLGVPISDHKHTSNGFPSILLGGLSAHFAQSLCRTIPKQRCGECFPWCLLPYKLLHSLRLHASS